ncbi:MAG: extracellular solute-binding protein [Bacteroidales bacterium]|nr:extracellular solute-binding protein [Clostridium sp.]MCM1203166.1 extracellular solute-binding protein [Bacteroidales bacterium]
MKRFLERFYIAIIFIFLYAPIIMLMVLSFNRSRTRAKWGGFTVEWYKALFQNQGIMEALYHTLFIALVSSVIATLIGTITCIALNSMKAHSRTILLGINNIPMLNADIVTGISLMLLFISFGFRFGLHTILLAHITFNIPYVILNVMPKFRQLNPHTYEAALDLGASPLYAFFKVVFPDILPGILSGFLMAFTMSLDDFVITHFTKGAGVDTLSTKIYTEVRKGIKPEMYALSTIIFITVFVLLLMVNLAPAGKEKQPASEKKRYRIPKKPIAFAIISVLVICTLVYSNRTKNKDSGQVIVYNWGEYLDPEVLTLFTEETGIEVIYDEYETNENMYPKIESGAAQYDLVCPSDYMVQKLLEKDLLAEINFEHIPNIENIDKNYMRQSREFDPENKYSIPYCVGTVGILYNKTMVDEPVDSWDILWNPSYADSILMQDSVRDAFMVSLKRLGYSMNSKTEQELEEAKEALIEQKPLTQAYVVDQVRDKMIGNEAAIGVIYSGEAIYSQRENENLEYVIPKEGTNVWIDSWCILKNAPNKENAEAFINFLCRPDIALMNFEYITYSTPNIEARKLIEDEDIRNSEIAFPDLSRYDNLETFQYLGEDADRMYNDFWKEIKSR